MRLKKEVVIKLLIAISFALISSCKLFKFPERNRDLQFIAGDTIFNSVHCTNPVVSPDGKTVYFLKIPKDSILFSSPCDIALGSVYAIDINGKNERKILDGIFGQLSISPDEKKLAIHPYKRMGENEEFKPDSLILIYHLSSGKIDTFSVTKDIFDIEFRDIYWIYYSVVIQKAPLSGIQVFRLNLKDSTRELIKTVEGYYGFDVLKDGLYI